MSVKLVGQWLQDYGVQSFQGACTFAYKEHIDLTVETSNDETYVFLHAILAEVSEVADAAKLRRLLQMNYLGKETGGATLALDGTGRNVILWIALPVAMLDLEQFELSIGSFLDLSEQLSAKIISNATN